MLTHEAKSKILDDVWPQTAWKRPDSIIRDEPTWFQVITPSSKVLSLNEIYRSQIKLEDVDTKIETVINDYKSHLNPFRWVVTNSCQPTNLPDSLNRYGFKCDYEAYGLCGDANTFSSLTYQDIVVKELSLEVIDEWVEAAIDGWSNPPSFKTGLRSDVLRAMNHERDSLRYYSAFIGNKIAGTGTLRICENSGHLIGSSVRPDFRGRGVYRALVAKRASISKELRRPLITTHAISNTSAPILKNLGLEKINTVRQFSFTFE